MSDVRTENAPTAQLVSQLSEQMSTLVRDELTLARLEMTEKGKRAGTGVGLLGGAGVIALYGVGALFVTAGALLALVLPVWAAALIGKKQVKKALPPEPEDAMASGRRDVETVKSAIREGRH